MKQDGYRLPRDACIRYVLFYQLREKTTMKWIRTQWADFFKRLDESFVCKNKVEQFAVDFFRNSRAVPENTFCDEWARSISNEQRSRYDEKQRIRSKKMAPKRKRSAAGASGSGSGSGASSSPQVVDLTHDT
jgi:hypothetical protein